MKKAIVRRPLPQTDPLDSTDLPDILRRIFRARGITREELIDHSLKRLQSVDQLHQVDLAARYLADAVMEGQRILIVGDFDADGATSTAVGILGLQAMGAAQVDFLVPNRFDYGYGLSPEIVEVAKGMAPDVLVTVDNGVSSVEGVAAARQAGMRVIVTDHHLPGAEIPEADAIVNPNAPGCVFPSKNLAGVGVIFYVLTAVRRELRARNWFAMRRIAEPNLADFLDIVALGTVADVVPLDHNNRILVQQGLMRIRAGRTRPGIQALIDVTNRRRQSLVAADLGFAIAPRLNAAGRLEDMSIGIECLLTDSPHLARDLALQLDEFNQSRKLIESEMQEQAMLALNSLHLRDGGDLPWGICLFDENWHQGVIGILASRIKERLHRPVITFAPSDEQLIKGSARSIPGLHMRDALDMVAKRYPGVLVKFGGHAMAAGMTVARERFTEFARAFDETVRTLLNEEDLNASIVTDGPLRAEEFNLETAQLIREAAPWGQHFPEPLFDGEFELIEQRLVGSRHLKMVLREPGSGQYLDGIAFNVDTRQWPRETRRVRLAYKLDINLYRGRQSLQLLVDYLEAC